MKKLLVIFSLKIVFCVVGYSQTYYPFFNESKEWRHVQQLCPLEGGCINFVTISYFKGDTVFNDIRYGKLYQKQVQPNIETETLNFLIEEDTLNEKVYVHDFRFNKTALLYDFKLQKGDSFDIYVMDDIYLESKVTNVDTIILGNKKLKRILFDSSDILIEGIGFVSPNYITSPGELICVRDGNSIIYINENYKNCDTIFTQGSGNIVENSIIDKTKSFIIYPNPVESTSIIRLCLENYNKFQLEIYNCSGTLVKKDSFVNNYPIGLSNLNKGLYIVKIVNKEKIIGIDKLIIK